MDKLGFYNPLLELFDRAVADGFVKPSSRDLVLADDDPAALLTSLDAPLETPEPKWIRSPEET